MVIRAVDSDMLGDIFLECLHEGFKILFATHFAEVLGREVAVHARAIPIALDGLAMQFNVDFVLLA